MTGFHGATGAEWVEKLDRLLSDSDLRRRLGVPGRAGVTAHFAAEARAPRVAEILRQVAS